MSVELEEGKIKIQLTRELFKDNLTNVILELDHKKIAFQGVKPDYYKPKHYLITEVPAEFSITLSPNNNIKELTYFCSGEKYSIKITHSSELIK